MFLLKITKNQNQVRKYLTVLANNPIFYQIKKMVKIYKILIQKCQYYYLKKLPNKIIIQIKNRFNYKINLKI